MYEKRNALRFTTAAVVALFVTGCGDEYHRESPSTGGMNGGGASSRGGSVSTGGSSSKGGHSPAGGVLNLAGTSASTAMSTAGAGVSTSGGTSAVPQANGGSSGATDGASAGSAGIDGTAGSTSRGPRFHVFLLLGQSNMAGYPKALDTDRVEDERVKVLGYDVCAVTGRQENVWDTAAPPLHGCWSDAIGPGDYFAKTLLARLPAGDTIGLVPCAVPGERIETFLKVGGTKYDWILQRARLAQQAGGVIEGLLFHQGESNNSDSNWPNNVKTFVTDLRTDLGLGDVPFLAGELLRTGDCAAHNVLVNQLPSVISNAHVVSAETLTEDATDTEYNLHFSHEAQVTLGQRYAEKITPLLDW